MPIINRIAEFQAEMTAWRRDLHAHPEIAFEEVRTSGIVAEKLREFGCDEVVDRHRPRPAWSARSAAPAGRQARHRPARRHGRAADPRGDRLRLRLAAPRTGCTPAAMTATPPCCSAPPGTWPRRATSTAPSTSSSSRPRRTTAAAASWSRKGCSSASPSSASTACTTGPAPPAGTFRWRDGPIMAAVDNFEITITGKGAHGAMPHLGNDPVVIAAAASSPALQTHRRAATSTRSEPA